MEHKMREMYDRNRCIEKLGISKEVYEFGQTDSRRDLKERF